MRLITLRNEAVFPKGRNMKKKRLPLCSHQTKSLPLQKETIPCQSRNLGMENKVQEASFPPSCSVLKPVVSTFFPNANFFRKLLCRKYMAKQKSLLEVQFLIEERKCSLQTCCQGNFYISIFFKANIFEIYIQCLFFS